MAAWRLAFHFHRPLSELNMSRRDFNQALAYLQIEPAEEPANLRAASVMAQIANWSGKTMKDGKSAKPSDYIGKPPEPARRQTADEQKEVMRSLKPRD